MQPAYLYHSETASLSKTSPMHCVYCLFTVNYCTLTVLDLSFHIQASGGQDRVVHVWDVKTNSHVHTFKGHRDTVSVSAYMAVYILYTAAYSNVPYSEDVLEILLYIWTIHSVLKCLIFRLSSAFEKFVVSGYALYTYTVRVVVKLCV